MDLNPPIITQPVGPSEQDVRILFPRADRSALLVMNYIVEYSSREAVQVLSFQFVSFLIGQLTEYLCADWLKHSALFFLNR